MKRPFVLSGAVGNNSANVNGTYYITDETHSGKPVYAKKSGVDTCIYYATDGKWYVTSTANMKANECWGWAYTEKGLVTPMAAKAWLVNVNGKYVAQALKTVTMVAYLFSHYCCSH